VFEHLSVPQILNTVELLQNTLTRQVKSFRFSLRLSLLRRESKACGLRFLPCFRLLRFD